MSAAFDVLGLPPTASDAEIRSRYLQLVREFPPDRAPDRFAEIRAAFDDLRDPMVRLERQMFSLSSRDSLVALAEDIKARLRSARLSADTLLALAEST